MTDYDIGTYPWSFETQILCSGDDRKTFKVVTSTSPLGSISSVASLSAATSIGIT